VFLTGARRRRWTKTTSPPGARLPISRAPDRSTKRRARKKRRGPGWLQSRVLPTGARSVEFRYVPHFNAKAAISRAPDRSTKSDGLGAVMVRRLKLQSPVLPTGARRAARRARPSRRRRAAISRAPDRSTKST